MDDVFQRLVYVSRRRQPEAAMIIHLPLQKANIIGNQHIISRVKMQAQICANKTFTFGK